MKDFTREEFEYYYFDLGLPYRECAKEMGISIGRIRYAYKKWGIKARNKSEANKLAEKKGRRPCRSGENNPNYIDGKSNRFNKYGITEDIYNSMLVRQGNKCVICEETFNKTPHIDHCHSTLEVRGLLCGSCNTAIGLLKDSTNNLSRAIKYLNKSNTDARWDNRR